MWKWIFFLQIWLIDTPRSRRKWLCWPSEPAIFFFKVKHGSLVRLWSCIHKTQGQTTRTYDTAWSETIVHCTLAETFNAYISLMRRNVSRSNAGPAAFLFAGDIKIWLTDWLTAVIHGHDKTLNQQCMLAQARPPMIIICNINFETDHSFVPTCARAGYETARPAYACALLLRTRDCELYLTTSHLLILSCSLSARRFVPVLRLEWSTHRKCACLLLLFYWQLLQLQTHTHLFRTARKYL